MKGTELRAQKNTERIIRAALELFQSQGIKKVAVSDVARKAGVTPATVYNRFGSKDDLVRETVKAWYREMLIEYIKVIRTGENFEEKFHNLLAFKSDLGGKIHSEFALVMSSDDPEIRAFLEAEYMKDVTSAIYQFFEEGRQQGYVNPDLKTETIIKYTELIRKGLNAEQELVSDPAYIADLIREMTPLMLYGILGKPQK